jgi:hypothetical protein
MSEVINSFIQGLLCTLVAWVGGRGWGGHVPSFMFRYKHCFGLHSKAAWSKLSLEGDKSRKTTYWAHCLLGLVCYTHCLLHTVAKGLQQSSRLDGRY